MSCMKNEFEVDELWEFRRTFAKGDNTANQHIQLDQTCLFVEMGH